MHYREQILCYALRYQGEWKRMQQAILKEEPWSIQHCAYAYITIVDKQYPCKLRKLQNPPWILFYQGDLSLCESLGVAIIGSRQASAYGISMCAYVTKKLMQRYVIISGLAKGIDGIAHKEALPQHTIAVIGCGLDIFYPKVNANLQQVLGKRQLLLSEYPPTTPPQAHHFPWRNRILAALSEAVIVIEAGMHSGTMLTVNEALLLDIPIYCIPHPFDVETGRGGNFLISQGANILVDEQDIRMI